MQGSTKRSKYHASYAGRYRLRKCSRDAASGDVESVACRFCTVFGKEDNSVSLEGQPAPRKKTTNPKTWASFRTYLFEKHLRGQQWSVPSPSLCQKDDKCTYLTDLSLEGVLHCKQWHRLISIKSVNGGSVWGSY
jgi:hypothetical protein